VALSGNFRSVFQGFWDVLARFPHSFPAFGARWGHGDERHCSNTFHRSPTNFPTIHAVDHHPYSGVLWASQANLATIYTTFTICNHAHALIPNSVTAGYSHVYMLYTNKKTLYMHIATAGYSSKYWCYALSMDYITCTCTASRA
jgi:hypothetical protein